MGRFDRYEGRGRMWEEGRETDWDVPGPYRGRGPKGYRKSDEKLYQDVSENLMEDGSVDARDIEVEVRNALVTLRGTVENWAMKRRSEEVAELVPGVRDIINELRVRDRPYRTEREPERQTRDRDSIRPGMMVVDRTGDPVGRVKEIRSDYFVINRRLEPDISMDMKAVTRVKGDVLYVDPDVPDRLMRRGDFPKV